MAHSQRTASGPPSTLTRTAAARLAELTDLDSAFSGPVCPSTIVLPEADYDAFAQVVNADEPPNEKLAAGAEWFRQSGF